MIQCPRCGRHHKHHESHCPFCQRKSGGLLRKLGGVAAAASAMVLVACYGGATLYPDTGPEAVDADGDGYMAWEECDDENADIFPGAEELCDEVDNDCDGDVDEGVLLTFYEDTDGDGFAGDESQVEACELPEGFYEHPEDCDDGDAAINPDALEECDDKVDNDCDHDVDMDDEDCLP